MDYCMSAQLRGFNFFAHIGGNFGLAVAARHTLAWLLSQRQPVCLRDANTGDPRFRLDHTYDTLVTHWPWGLPYDVNIFHLNPPEIDAFLAVEWQLLPIDQRMSIAVPFWELPSLPPLWRDVLAEMDLVLAPTRFVQTAVQHSVPGARTLHFPIAIPTPAPARPDRTGLGLPEQGLIFLSAFDVVSDMHRKNPWAAIEAFQAAFTAQEPVCLVVKLNNSSFLPEVKPQLDRLRQVAAADRRIVLVDRHLSQPDLFSLYASCDVFVSLHRAEGLGLILMEMMSLAKPVITTAWSGNMDFTNLDNACLVDYDMVRVQATLTPYQDESARSEVLWADPRVATAVAWMRRLYAEPTLRARIGQQAAWDMRQRAEADRSATLAEIQRLLWSPEIQAGHPARARRMFQRRIDGLTGTIRHAPRESLRRVAAVAREALAPGGAVAVESATAFHEPDPKFRT
jgi:glycosyltransferase involved in cell wall biosynthesis